MLGGGERERYPFCILKSYLRPEFLNHVLALEIPDLNGGSGSSAQPVPEYTNIYYASSE